MNQRPPPSRNPKRPPPDAATPDRAEVVVVSSARWGADDRGGGSWSSGSWYALGISAVVGATAGAPAPAPPKLAAEGGLAYDVRDAKTGKPIPCKLTFVGVDGTRDPEFTRVDIARQEGDGAIAAFNRVMSLTGVGVTHVPLGTYDVTVSRGPEWEISTTKKLKLTARGATISRRLAHVVETPGWLSADFHVHAARSSDSRVPMYDRIFEFVADDVQMIVATDHNVISDYEPYIKELDAGRYITSAIGDELTTNGWGHFGAFPLPRDIERAGEGAVLVHGRKPDDFFKDVRRDAPGAIINVHHPRIDNEIGYFDLGQFDARSDRAGRAGFSWDFDALEVMNGYQDPVRRSVDRVVDDWFSLLNHDHLVTATGNSDTHHLTFNIGGYPRNYVKVREDKPERIDPKEIASADQGPPRLLHHRPVRLAGGQRRDHRRSGAGARREGARRGDGAGGPLGLGQPRDALPERRGGQALDRAAGDRRRPLERDLRPHHAARRVRRGARRRRSVDVAGGRRRQDVHRLSRSR